MFDDLEELFGFIGFLFAVMLAAILLLIVLSLPVSALLWYQSGKQAEIYNRICKPNIPVSTSDIFWMDGKLNTLGCNIAIDINNKGVNKDE